MARNNLIATLNQLIELNLDSAKGFVRAQNDVTDEKLVDLFDALAARRTEMVEELQRMVQQRGGEPKSDTDKGSLERGWLNIKAAMTIEYDKTDALVLADRAKHEADVVKEYEDLLEKGVASEIRDVVRNQYQEIKDVQEQLAKREEDVQTTIK